MTDGKQDRYGAAGEALTSALLLRRFFVWKRTPDTDGADFLVQLPFHTLEERRKRQDRIEVFGIVQSKYFEGRNEVKVQKQYVEDDRGPRSEFFVVIHSSDEETQEPVRYFFTAPEVAREFRLRDRHYVFSLTHSRRFEEYRARTAAEVFETIAKGLQAEQDARNERFAKFVLERWAKLDPCPITVDLSPKERVVREAGREHRLRERPDGTIETTIRDALTGATVTGPDSFGPLHNQNYDPITRSFTQRSACPGNPEDFDYDPLTDSWTAKR